MEANEAQELQEQHERAAESKLKPASFTMSLLAVLVAITTVLGHRTHTEAVLSQTRASDAWNAYQARKIRQNDTELTVDLLSSLATRDAQATAKLIAGYKAHVQHWADETNQDQEHAHELEAEVRHAERKAGRFDLAEALLEIGLVITSITLLTRQRAYWYLGIGFGAIGVVIAASVLLLH
jgi:Domain of unknown function (DUF4337)